MSARTSLLTSIVDHPARDHVPFVVFDWRHGIWHSAGVAGALIGVIGGLFGMMVGLIALPFKILLGGSFRLGILVTGLFISPGDSAGLMAGRNRK